MIEIILRLLSAVLVILVGIVIGSQGARYFKNVSKGLALVVSVSSGVALLITVVELLLAMHFSLPFGRVSITSHEELLDFLQSVGQSTVRTISIFAELLITNIFTSTLASMISYALTYIASASRDLDIPW